MTRWRRLVAVLFLLVVAPSVPACSSGANAGPGAAPRQGGASGNATTQPPPGGAVPAGLERFYRQTLSWGPCLPFATTPDEQETYASPQLQCAYLEVPLSYADPDGQTAKIALLRKPASDPKQRIGSLVINPGGPGASGTSAAAAVTDRVAAAGLAQRFDLVGFDPRGVGASQPAVHCLTPAEQDAERAMNLTVDSSPAGVARTEGEERTDSSRCATRSGTGLLANLGTRDVARDMDIMRAALGDAKLTYVGFSYGTRLATGYAEDFPGNVRAMVLDGAVAPENNTPDELVGQAKGFQGVFNAFAAWCVVRPDCALGHNKDQDKGQASHAFQAMVRPLITAPVPVPDGRRLSYTDATTGTTQALYLPALWPALNRGLLQLSQHNGDLLMRLADLYYDRSADGTYSNQADAFQAIRCADYPPLGDPRLARETDAKVREAAPFLDTGLPPSPARDICAFWPLPPTSVPHHPHIAGLPTVMVISTTHDPATPYQNGVDLARDLNARLFTFNGNQHTAFLQGNPCVDQAAVAYLTNLTLPAEGAGC
jgi:pimeloyl-ACP methyl ester carboxylesterase